MTKIKTTCDNCGKLTRKYDMRLALSDPRFTNLCPICFDLWLDDKLDEVRK